MRKLLAFILLAIPAFGTTTVSGHIANLDTTTPGSTAFVRFWLRGCRGNQPRITGTGAIAPQFSGTAFYVDLPANSSGNVSATIYSTRDNTGTGNGDIECGGSYTAVWYGMQIYNNNVPGPEVPIHAKSGSVLDPSNVTPITTLPVVQSPTGDSTYFRLDGGNSPITGGFTAQGNNTFTGSNTFQGVLNCKNLEGIRCVDGANSQGWAGANLAAWIQSADSDLGSSTPGIIFVSAAGSSITSAITLGTRHSVQLYPGTYTLSASITLGQNSCIYGQPGSWTDDDTTIPEQSVILKQANGANLANLILAPNAEGCLQDLTLDGNRSNNTTTTGVKVTALRFHTDRVVIAEMPVDGIDVTSTGSTNNAGGAFLDRLAAVRNTGNGLSCTGSADARVFHGFYEFNGGAGILLTNCNSPLIKFNEISSNKPGIAATGSSTANILTGSYPGINMNSMANNQCAASGRGADIDINGFDGSVGGQVPDAQIIGNRFVGSNATSNTCPSVNLQDTANVIFEGNTVNSVASNTYTYGFQARSVSSTEGRDHVLGNNFLGTFGTGVKIGTTQTVFCQNNENGTTTFEECDTNNGYTPNNQSMNAKDSGGTVRAWTTPLDSSNNTDFGASTIVFSPYGNTTPLLKLSDTTNAQSTPVKWLTSSSGEFRVINSALSVNLLRLNDSGLLSTAAGIAGTSGGNVLISPTAPTIAAAGCGGSAASISVNNGTASFNINVGTAPTSAGCTVTLPTATTGWNCSVNDFTTISTSVFVQKQTASSTTSATFQNYSDVAVATAPTANDIYHVQCSAN